MNSRRFRVSAGKKESKNIYEQYELQLKSHRFFLQLIDFSPATM